MSKKIILADGAYIEFTSKSVRFYTKQGDELSEVRASSSVVKILEVLLKHPGKIIDNEVLFQATRTVHSHKIQDVPAQAVSKAVRRLPRQISKNIINERNEGYKILVAEHTAPYYRTKGELQDLVGDYYAFYLDPNTKEGAGKLLQAFIRISQDGAKETNMSALAVLRIQNNEVLNRIAEEASGNGHFFDKFDEYCATLHGENRNCFLVYGEVKDCGQNVVAITLQNKSGGNEIIDRWNIVLNLKDYMLDARQRVDDDDLYRGGSGMMIGGWTKWGMIANQIVLIRKSKNKAAFQHLNVDDIVPFLRSENHVRLDETGDKEFYIWLMKKWPITLE